MFKLSTFYSVAISEDGELLSIDSRDNAVYDDDELLSKELGDNQWLCNIQYENGRMGTLVGQMLELARTENIATQMETVELDRLVGGEALPFESVAFEKGLTGQTDAGWDDTPRAS